jgi:predicted amidophosphoribosyltransferase
MEEAVKTPEEICYNCKKAREQIYCSLVTYTSTTASTGQTSIQVPHSVHSSWFMTYFSSPSSMASAGHSSAQVPHATHSSVIS